MLKGLPESRVVRLFEEHAVVELPQGTRLSVGDLVEVIPTHICPVFNLFDRVHVTRGGRLIATWPVDAGGCSQ
jgi:D-serine deaminase-like pyridoxal phosphate-dependent protein